MVRSGITVSDEAKKEFDSMKTKEHDKKYDYIIFRIGDDQKEIVIKETAEHGTTASHERFGKEEAHEYLALKEKLEAEKTPLWGVVYVRYDGKFKLTMVYWCPEDAKTKEKMVATSTHDTMKKVIPCSVVLQCNDSDELSLENVTGYIKKFSRT